MKRVNKVAEGLLILSKYEGCDIAAEHDVVTCGPDDPSIVNEEDKRRLEDLGWHIDGEFGCWARFV